MLHCYRSRGFAAAIFCSVHVYVTDRRITESGTYSWKLHEEEHNLFDWAAACMSVARQVVLN